jgi:hypothetical protein
MFNLLDEGFGNRRGFDECASSPHAGQISRLGGQADFRRRRGVAAGRGQQGATDALQEFGTLNHTHVVDLIWQAHLEGRRHGFGVRDLGLYPDIAEL